MCCIKDDQREGKSHEKAVFWERGTTRSAVRAVVLSHIHHRRGALAREDLVQSFEATSVTVSCGQVA